MLKSQYLRIVSIFQPPLYNVIMYFWLKVISSQWWLRFFGVVMGFAGIAGLYKSVRKLNGSQVAASGAVIFSSCVFHLLYFWRGCSEYCLMLGVCSSLSITGFA